MFHWLLALAVAAAFATGLEGGNWMVWHGRLGIFIVGLLVFRLVWGLVGSTYARFSRFVPGPTALVAYLQGRWRGFGHNPLGALSVLTLLGLSLFQAFSGLFANDDIAFDGPLRGLVSKSTSDWLTGMHRQVVWWLLGLVVLHIGAVLFHTFVHKDNLIRPMIDGMKPATDPSARSATGGGRIALGAALAIAILAMWASGGGFLPPPAPAQVPAW